MKEQDIGSMVGDQDMSIMTTGGELSILMIITFEGRIFQIINTGEEAHGEMSIGGGIGRLDSYMIRSILLQKEILDGGMVFQITKTYLQII